ncbi:hypothetical protein [Streptomyces wuyuanensis]|uniref:Uncharacterized protein n=1 Tax=Streptomyces wuyuanensis TaxID=1196353 RepID=A0A1G9TSF7_9ACTN|nr:hypothetical protein [Streptomyces wuyuanensis]SDM50637.1 hypothetical protein SAMN05444921_10981 [Streptomyces wuyuanensis]
MRLWEPGSADHARAGKPFQGQVRAGAHGRTVRLVQLGDEGADFFVVRPQRVRDAV